MPLDDRILVKPDEKKDATDGGIYLPDVGKEPTKTGRVVSAGPGGRHEKTGIRIPLSVSIGDLVVYGPFGGTDIEIDGEIYKVMRECDVLAIL